MLNMAGHIDSVFQSVPAVRIPMGGVYVDGIWQGSEGHPVSHKVNIQPASEREIQNLGIGGERITDARRIYINDGVLAEIKPSDMWEFDAGYGVKRWKCVRMDNRPWRSYCKVIVSRLDDQ